MRPSVGDALPECLERHVRIAARFWAYSSPAYSTLTPTALQLALPTSRYELLRRRPGFPRWTVSLRTSRLTAGEAESATDTRLRSRSADAVLKIEMYVSVAQWILRMLVFRNFAPSSGSAGK